MAGTIFGLPLSQQFDSNKDFLAGGFLYLYAAGTSTPVDAFEDYGLTAGLELPHPIVLDSAGRIPEFWLDDGSYRVRLTSEAGIVVFDKSSVVALGPSTGDSGSSAATVSPNSVFQTGDMLWQPKTGTRTDWVRANARTIGSSASGATERANADVQALFEYLWTNFSDTLCPVSSGRGGSATADFNANKTIGTLDMRGRAAYGLDDMGNTAASVLVDATPTAAASAVGAEKATVARANLPNENLSHSLSVSPGTNVRRGGSTTSVASGGGEPNMLQNPSSDNVSIAGSIPIGGSGTALNVMSPGRLGSWYIRL